MTKMTTDPTIITATPTVALKFLRCVEFTLPDGRTFSAKLLGGQEQSILDAQTVVAAFNREAR